MSLLNKLMVCGLVLGAIGCGEENAPSDKRADAKASAAPTSGLFGYMMLVRYDEDIKQLMLIGATCHGGNCEDVRPDVTITADGIDIPRDNAANYELTQSNVEPKSPWPLAIVGRGTGANDVELTIDLRRAGLKGEPEWNTAGDLVVHWQGEPLVDGEDIELFIHDSTGKNTIYYGSLDSEERATLVGDTLTIAKQYTSKLAAGDYQVSFGRSHTIATEEVWPDAPLYELANSFGRYYSAPEPLHIPARG